MCALLVPLDVVSDDCSLERVRRCPTNARVHYFFAAPKRTRKMCRKGIGRPMQPQQSGALCSIIVPRSANESGCPRAPLWLPMCDPSMRRPLYASASALISATAVLSVTASLHAGDWCAPYHRRLQGGLGCDEPRSVCTKCVCLYVHSVQVYRSCGVPVLLTRSNRMNNTS